MTSFRGTPLATPPKATPIAIPSGILWTVIAAINNIHLFNDAISPLFFLLKVLSKNLSDTKTNIPPNAKPIVGNIHSMYPNSSDSSNAGASKDQNDAAIITPALNPSIVANIFLFISLKKQTTKAPIAVIPHVNIVAITVWKIGFIFSNHSNINHLTI